MKPEDLAPGVYHTLLQPQASKGDIRRICNEAMSYGFASVCVNPKFVRLARMELKGSDVRVCTVIGFPLGSTTTETKMMEAIKAVADGADEIDMVIDIGAAVENRFDRVEKDINMVVRSVPDHIIVKTILETCYLTDEQIVNACLAAKRAGADFVKTSTGFGPKGADINHVKIMRETVGSEMGVKASGGIRDFVTAVKMIEAGATRIGTSSSLRIIGR